MRKRHITVPKGFVAGAVSCGIKTTKQEDLAIIAGESDVAAAIVTTRNQVVGAAVKWCRQALPRGCGTVRGLLVNSGNANTCNGPGGMADAAAMARHAARRLGTTPEKVLVASTGIIGHRLPMAKVRRGIADAAARLGTHDDGAVLRALMTTDTQEKSAVVQARIGRRPVTVAGIVKGAGMIAPSMATMIGVVTTDAAATPAALRKALREAVDASFNTVTIDSDQSTSDTVVLMASGAAGGKAISAASPACRRLAAAVREVCSALARAMVADGEGATKVVEVAVRGARSARDAEAAAKSVANSPLVKCAVHGGDPNWGRIVCALGKSPARIDPERLVVRIGGVTVFAGGAGRRFDLAKVCRHMAGLTVRFDCDLGLGHAAYTALTCDLSHEYVTINAEYHT